MVAKIDSEKSEMFIDSIDSITPKSHESNLSSSPASSDYLASDSLDSPDDSSLDDLSFFDESAVDISEESAINLADMGAVVGEKRSRKWSAMRWFANLPVQNKQLLGLFTSEIISIIGLMGVASFLIIASGRTQLIQQAEAEVAVTEIQYGLKINQMGFGFRGQSDNPAIIRAALLVANGQTLTPTEQNQLKRIFQNEVSARQIEYATLVGRDLRIISSANADRTRQIFDPVGLVSEVIENPRQIKVSAIVPWAELQQEQPPLPDGFTEQDALIRYTITPVLNPANGDVVGVLVSGDIVNNKLPIVQGTLDAFNNGYAAVYQRQTDGEFYLATSMDVGNSSDFSQAQVNAPLPDKSLLEAAISAPDGTASQRIKIGNHPYSAAAKVIKDINDQPVAVLVRGTSEASLNALISNSLRVQLIIAALALAADVFLAIALGRTIAQPLNHLQIRTKQFAAGNRKIRAELDSKDELGQLARTFNDLAETIAKSERRLMGRAEEQTLEAERANFLADLAIQARQSMKSKEIISLWIEGARSVLQVDRVIFYKFDQQWRGMVTAESVGDGWPVSLDDVIYDPCFADQYIEKYRQGRVLAVPDIYSANLTECHLNQLEPYGVRANIVVPVIVADELDALLIAHQCDRPRQWTESEANFFKQLSIQLGYALSQVRLFEQKEEARLAAEALSEQQRKQKESLQMQLVELLSDVENAASGDLTVRANVTAGDIGTVADFFNSIIENLRQIVVQVKESSTQVNTALGENADSIRSLADTALKQAEETTSTLASMEDMIHSINVVAERAQEAANVAHTALMTAESGGEAMDQTVRTILGLRATVGETAKKVKRLGEASQQISKVVSLINQIAMQTNLLAINAGIEAARAGEEGQGFAVVAEEVGELAARSAAATQEIEAIVENIQLETNQVAEAMEMGTAQVVEGTLLVEGAKKSLSQIMAVSRQIDELVAAISHATVSQVQTSESVSRLMTEMAKVSEQTSRSSLQVSNSLQETVAIAQSLQESVNTFKVEGVFEVRE